jgi:hypothetical protein
VYHALLEWGEAAKVSEITQEMNNSRISYPLVRRILSDSPRFMTIDRMWDLSARYMDTSRPTERNAREVLEAAGLPLSTSQISNELSLVYNRPSEYYFQLTQKLGRDAANYFRTDKGDIGLRVWLPLVDGEDESEIIYDNKVSEKTVQTLLRSTAEANWSDYAAATRAVVGAARGQAVPHRLVGVVGWMRLREKYDPVAHLKRLSQ